MPEHGWTPAGLARLVPGRLSTGMKMLLILTLALLPLGLIALFASIQSASTKQAQRVEDARVTATAEARQVDLLLLRGAPLLRSAASGGGTRRCNALSDAGGQMIGAGAGVALFAADGQPICPNATVGPAPAAAPPIDGKLHVQVDRERRVLLFALADRSGRYAVGAIPASLLRQVLAIGPAHQGLAIRQGDTELMISPSPTGGLFTRKIEVETGVAGGQATLHLELLANPITATEIALVLLPLLMWAAAAAIGWTVVDQLLLRPLAQLQRAIQDCGTSGQTLVLPRLTTPAREIKDLGESFQLTTAQLIRREAELEEGLNHQVRLTREVHHRVKNNLQVVASLINLHARGTSGEVAGAYMSIQRRVDALAVVHRNHYAELEENRGVALRSIVAELTANLRGAADPLAPQPVLTLDMTPAFVSQDVAVPVSFLITEIVELVMLCAPTGSVAITLSPGAMQDKAILAIEAPCLSEVTCLEHPTRERFERIVTGLARQLRAALEFDPARGRYSIAITIVPDKLREGATSR
jgi:two-component system, sensor histidine kinase PdtaS